MAHACPDTDRNNEENPSEGPSRDPVLLARRIVTELEELEHVLNDPSAHWLRGMIDVLRVYVDHFPSVPNHLCALHTTSGVILRRGLQSFIVDEREFDQVRNAFRRCNRYREKQRMGNLRRRGFSCDFE
ncbi:MAG: hypothetical protein HC884_09745 [Chloroflexaceae bacterium]|nr:hypothetical protein [Chloroflexaceae bacterium]